MPFITMNIIFILLPYAFYFYLFKYLPPLYYSWGCNNVYNMWGQMVQFDRGQLMHFALGSLEGIGLKKVLLRITGTHPTFESFRVEYLYTRFHFSYGPQLKNTSKDCNIFLRSIYWSSLIARTLCVIIYYTWWYSILLLSDRGVDRLQGLYDMV